MREGEDVYYPELSAVTFVTGACVLADAVRRLEPDRRMVLRRILEMCWPGLSGMGVSTA
ncbi:hypothetical protein [Streptomyces sp. JNUCC 63]